MSLENRIEDLTVAVRALTDILLKQPVVVNDEKKACCSEKSKVTEHKAEVVKPIEPNLVGIEIVETVVADPLAELKLPNGKIAKRFLELSNGGKGRDQQAALLKQFGAKTVKDIKVEDIAAFAEALEICFLHAHAAEENVPIEEKPKAIEGELMDKDYDKPFASGTLEFESHFDRETGILAVPYIKAGIEKQKILCAQFGIAKLSLLPRGRVGEMLKAIEEVAK